MSELNADQAGQGTEEHLSKLVGEGNKYADTENLAKGYVNLEAHLETIKAEKAGLEEKLGIQAAKDNHLETIVNMLKEPAKAEPEPDPEPIIEEEVKVKEEVKQPVMSTQANLSMAQFAKDAVAKYGDAHTAGKHLQKYIGDDKGRQALVQSMMETDPSSLLKILPAKDKSYNPTGSEGTPQNEATLPLTWDDCLRVRKENPAKYKSPSFVRQMMDARALAKQKGIPFGND